MNASLKIFKHLKNNGFDVYFPNQYKGDVKSDIVVVYNMGQHAEPFNYDCGRTLIHLILHVNQDKYTDIITLHDRVRRVMKCLKGVRSTGLQTPVINDDTKKSYTTSIEYEVTKKL